MIEPCPEILQPWWKWYPYVGTFIGVLAGVGVLVPWFRGSKIGAKEKAFWSCLMIGLVLLEIRSITLDGHQHDMDQALARCRELQSFKEIAADIGTAIANGQTQFDSTSVHVEGVLKTTQQVSDLAKANLEAITGGNSYAFATPQPKPWQSDISMSLQNAGNQILSGVSMTIATVIKDCVDVASPDCREFTDLGPMKPIAIGNLAGHAATEVPKFLHPVADGSGHFILLVSAQNGMVREDIWLRRAKASLGSAYRFEVHRVRIDKKSQLLRKVDWTEPNQQK